jgi:hypothetical protein
LDVKVDLDMAKATAHAYGQSMVFHCHHYNCFLQQTIEDPSYVDGAAILTDAAAEVAFDQIREFLAQNPQVDTLEERFSVAADLFRTFGFGTLDLSGLTEQGGVAVAPHSHYAFGWKSKFGPRETPVCFFVTGYLAGMMAAVADKPLGTYKATETACYAVAADRCSYKVEVK